MSVYKYIRVARDQDRVDVMSMIDLVLVKKDILQYVQDVRAVREQFGRKMRIRSSFGRRWIGKMESCSRIKECEADTGRFLWIGCVRSWCLELKYLLKGYLCMGSHLVCRPGKR